MSKKRLMANGYEFYTDFVVRGRGTIGFVHIEKTNVGLNEYAYKEWMKMEKIFCDLQQERIIRRRALAWFYVFHLWNL